MSEIKSFRDYASWMTGMTDKNSNMLAKIGITIGKGNKLDFSLTSSKIDKEV